MSLLEIIIIACGLSFDAFAVSVSSGTLKSCQTPGATFRLSFHFGLFQFLMPIIGWYVGYQVSDYVTTFDHWIAFILLFYIGSKMIYESSKEDEEKNGYNPSKGSKLILLSIATSIDALAVGLSLAFLKVEIFTPSLLIGIITATFSFLGVKIGRKFGKRYSQKAELLGGLILIGIGIKILIEHLSN